MSSPEISTSYESFRDIDFPFPPLHSTTQLDCSATEALTRATQTASVDAVIQRADAVREHSSTLSISSNPLYQHSYYSLNFHNSSMTPHARPIRHARTQHLNPAAQRRRYPSFVRRQPHLNQRQRRLSSICSSWPTAIALEQMCPSPSQETIGLDTSTSSLRYRAPERNLGDHIESWSASTERTEYPLGSG
jgi:hypothetical protein